MRAPGKPLAAPPALAAMMATALALFALSGIARAHLVTTGVGPFYDGMAHFFLSPEDIVATVALALFAGLTGRAAARALALALPAAWLVGALCGIAIAGEPVVGEPMAGGSLVGPWTALGILIAGLLAAANPRVPTLAPAALGCVLGSMHGFLNGRAMATTGTSVLAAFGIVAALAMAALLLSAAAASLTAPWQRIAARALGSWTAAIGLLALAWTLRSGG